MAYNYRRAEKAWISWKTKEEEELRKLGMDEDMIQCLHTYDWEQFKKERRYYHWHTNAGEANLWTPQPEQELVNDADDFLDSIEDERLFGILQETDKGTLEMLVMKLKKHTSREIAEKMGVSEDAVNLRIFKLKKKIKNFL